MDGFLEIVICSDTSAAGAGAGFKAFLIVSGVEYAGKVPRDVIITAVGSKYKEYFVSPLEYK